MKLVKLLTQNKSAIVKRWFDEVVATYPVDTAQFLKRQKDPFSNPVGNTTFKGLEALFDVLVHGIDTETVNSFLDPIIRIRAIQNFTPSQAVSFILFIKEIIKENFKKELKEHSVLEEFLSFESRIDDLCLMSFDIYMNCREKLFNIQASEMKNRTFRAFERAGLVKDVPDDSSTGLRLVTPQKKGE